MKNKILFALSLMLIFACQSNVNQKEETHKRVLILENKMYNDTLHQVKKKIVYDLIKEYDLYVNTYPQDSLTPGFLFKAGTLAKSFNMGQEAIKYFDKAYGYENFEKKPFCLLMQAVTYEEVIQDVVKAEESYKRFMNEYPDLAKTYDVPTLIENLGKSEEEIMARIIEKNE